MKLCCVDGKDGGGTGKGIEIIEPQQTVGVSAASKKKAEAEPVAEEEEEEASPPQAIERAEPPQAIERVPPRNPKRSTIQEASFGVSYVYVLDKRDPEVELSPFDDKSAIVTKVSGEPAQVLQVGTRIISVGGVSGSFNAIVEALKFHGLQKVVMEHPVRREVSIQLPDNNLGLKMANRGRMLALLEVGPGPVMDWSKETGTNVCVGDLICEVNGISGSPQLMVEAFTKMRTCTFCLLHHDLNL